MVYSSTANFHVVKIPDNVIVANKYIYIYMSVVFQ